MWSPPTDPDHVVAVVQPWISGDEVVGGASRGRFDYWSYPRGGNSIRSINGLTGTGATVSVAR